MAEYEEFLSSKAFAADFVAAYRGRHDPADALWWLEHPTVDSPNGRAAPAHDRPRLESLAFSRGGGVEAQRALQSLDAEIARDREDTLDALARIHPAGSQLAQAESVDPTVSPAIPGQPVTEVSGMPVRQNRWGWWVGSAAVIALIAGIGVGSSFSPTANPRSSPPSPTTTVSSSVASPKMLEVFSQRQVASDTPSAITFGTTLDASTFRQLGDFPATDSYSGVKVYAVRNMARSICLVLAIDEPLESTITCVPVADLGRSGISLYRQNETQFETVRWSSYGSLETNWGSISTLTPGG